MTRASPAAALPLRWRLPLLVLGLVGVVVVALLAAAYVEIESALAEAGAERARGAADQVADLLTQSVTGSLAEGERTAAEPALAAFLRSGADADRERALAVLRARGSTGRGRMELWTAAGERALAHVHPEGATFVLPEGSPPFKPGIGPLRQLGDTVFADVVLEVRDSAAAAPLGHLLLRRVATSAGSSEALARLVGSGASLAIGGGDVWTDLSRLVPPPPTGGEAGDGEPLVASVATVEGAPWSVWVGFPRAELVAPAQTFMARMGLAGLLFTALAVALTAWLAGRITRPLTELTVAAEGLAAGSPTAPVTGLRSDEVGRLAAAFNRMSERVGAAHERLEARAADLAESEARKAAIVESALDAIVTVDDDGRIVEFNPAAEALFGRSRATAAGALLAELIAPTQRRRGRLAQALASGDARVLDRRMELTALRADGTEFPAEVTVSGIPHGGPERFTAFVRDLTGRHEVEAARLRSLELEAENRRIEEANRLKSEFLANMSHELRTPLNAVIGFAELLHDGAVQPDMPEYREFLGDILTSARHLLQLINDVLDLSKVEAGKVEFRPEPVDLARLTAEGVAILRTVAAEAGIRVDVDVAPEARHAVVDAARLKQVLYNYLSNALKFTPAGGRVTVRVRPDGDDAFRLEVEDTGIGIAAEDLDRLFVEFTQLDAGAAKTHAGTGLGLALTRRLVEAQGGRVGVASVAGAGSTFWASLPRAAIHGRPLAPSRSRVAGTGVGAPSILVVEDNPADQAQLVRALVDAGYAVETAATAARAIERCRQHRFDAVTLDLLLPDGSGLDVLQALRQAGDQAGVPVVVVTVVAEPGAVAGFTVHDLLAKPLDEAALLASLRRAGLAPGPAGSILVVDDDPASLKLMTRALGEAGYRARSVERAADGLAAAATAVPGAVVLDLMMPEMDGFQFLDRFRALEGCRDVPVLVWTVKDLGPAEHARLSASAQTILQKGRGAAAAVAELRAVLPAPPPAAAPER